MTQKKLQKDSILNQYDLDGDNTITDEELQRAKEIKETKAENYIQMTEGYIYKPKDYTRQQKIHQGKIKKKDIRLADLLKESNRKVA